MAKISELDPLAGIDVDPVVDLLAIVDLSGSETMKITVAELFESFGGGGGGEGDVAVSSITPVTPFKLLGRYSPTTGPAQQIGLSAEFSLSGGVLAVANLPGGIVGTGINAANITTGILPPTRLSLTRTQLNTAVSDDNVAFVAVANTFSALNTFNVGLATNTIICFSPIATPSSPPAGKLNLYEKSNGKLYTRNSSGVETELGGASSIPAGVALLAGNNTFTGNNTFNAPVVAPLIYVETLLNPTWGNNSCIGLLATGTVVKRDVPDAAAVLSLWQANAASTGDILHCTSINGMAFRVGSNRMSEFVKSIGIGIPPSPAVGLYLYLGLSGSPTQYGLYSLPVGGIDALDSLTSIYAGYYTPPVAITVDKTYGLFVESPGVGATSSITEAYGIFIKNQGVPGVDSAYGLVIENPVSGFSSNIGLQNRGTTELLAQTKIRSSTTSQLRLENTPSIYSDITVDSGGAVYLNTTGSTPVFRFQKPIDMYDDCVLMSGKFLTFFNSSNTSNVPIQNVGSGSQSLFKITTGYAGNSGVWIDGSLGIGQTPNSAFKVIVFGGTSGAAEQYGLHVCAISSIDALTKITGIYAGLFTAAAAITVAETNAIYVPAPGVGATAGITYSAGIRIADQQVPGVVSAVGIDIDAQGSGGIGLRNGGPTVLNGSVLAALGYTSGAPSAGTAGVWKLGIKVDAAVTFDTAKYVQVDIGGVAYKLALAV